MDFRENLRQILFLWNSLTSPDRYRPTRRKAACPRVIWIGQSASRPDSRICYEFRLCSNAGAAPDWIKVSTWLRTNGDESNGFSGAFLSGSDLVLGLACLCACSAVALLLLLEPFRYFAHPNWPLNSLKASCCCLSHQRLTSQTSRKQKENTLRVSHQCFIGPHSWQQWSDWAAA